MNDYFVNVAGSKDSTFEDFDDHPKLMGLTQVPLILSSLICLVVVKEVDSITFSLGGNQSQLMYLKDLYLDPSYSIFLSVT